MVVSYSELKAVATQTQPYEFLICKIYPVAAASYTSCLICSEADSGHAETLSFIARSVQRDYAQRKPPVILASGTMEMVSPFKFTLYSTV